MRSIFSRICLWFLASLALTLVGFLAVSILFPPPSDLWGLLPYYFCILVVIALLCVALAFQVGSPLRQLRATMERFGHGDLGVRAESKRKDEFGDLARAFDAMADRIESLLSAERRLLRDVAHELRSPLTRLGFAVELAKTSPDREAALARIRKEASRLNDLVEQLLQVNRVEALAPEQQHVEVPLDLLFHKLVDDSELEAHARGSKICKQVEQPILMRGEPELLRRAIENILRNAVRHAPKGTTVETSLIVDDGYSVLSVRDHGSGVPPETLTEIFKPFYRVEGDRNRTSGGVGLGLAIAQRAVSLHGGTILAENANPGLRVTIRLPGAMARVENLATEAT